MEAKKGETVQSFYKKLAGQTITVHLVSGESLTGVVLDSEAGDLLLRRAGYEDTVLIPRHGYAAVTAGGGTGAAASASTTAEGGAEALPSV